MKRTLRKLVAFGAVAAMTLSTMPMAQASSITGVNLMIDNITIDTSIGANKDKTDSTLNAAIKAASRDYNSTTNTVTLTKLPSNLPYYRPSDYLRNTSESNYGAYLPLQATVAVHNGGTFLDLSDGVLKVDGKTYTVNPSTVTKSKGEIAAYFAGKDFVGGTAASIFSSKFDVTFASYESNGPVLYALTPGAPKTLEILESKILGSGVIDKSPNEIAAHLAIEVKYSARYVELRNALGNAEDKTTLENIVDTMLLAAVKELPTTGTGYAVADAEKFNKNMADAIVDMIKNETTSSTAYSTFVPVTVFHDMSINYVNEQTHTITFQPSGSNNVYSRSFTVKMGLVNSTPTGFTPVDAQKEGVNANNINAYTKSGSVVFDFSQKDLLATDTWGTSSTAYKVWDRSIIDAYGRWTGLNDNVLSGHTAYMNAKVLLRNTAGTTIPAGTYLTVTYTKKSTGTSNSYSFTMGQDGLFPVQVGMDKYDMTQMFNRTSYEFANISFSGTQNGVSYTGSFPIFTNATDRISVGSLGFDVGTFINMQPGESKDINALIGNSNAYITNIEFTSNDSTTVVVTSTGSRSAKLVAVKAGYAVITARSTSDNTSATLIVAVGTTATQAPNVTPEPTKAPDCDSIIGTFKVVTNSSALNVRSGMGTSYSKLGSLKKGATFNGELANGSDWVKLNYNGRVAYVSAAYCMYQN